MRYILLLLVFFMPVTGFAGPEIRVCLDGDCGIKQTIKISDQSWSEIQQLFSSPAANDQVERERLIRAISLMETDTLNKLAEKSSGASTTEIRDWMSDRDTALNIKSYISTLLDARLIKFHFIRKIEQRSSWFGTTENVCVIQSTTSGDIYAIKPGVDYQGLPEIESLKAWKRDKYLPGDMEDLFTPSEKFVNDNDSNTNE